MQPKFYGRKAELRALREELDLVVSSGSARVVTVRGRRQVGKSTLIEHFAEASDVPYASFVGMKGTPEDIQVVRALESSASSKRPLRSRNILEQAAPVRTWVSLLSLLRFAFDPGPAVVILDEFPWMNETSQGLDGLLKSLLDGELKRRPVLLILVGSDEAMMERLFEHDRPLFGKADRQLSLAPFNPAETAEALGPGRSATEIFDAQLVTGGFPGLVDQARRAKSAREFVKDSLIQKNAALVDAAQLRLAGEFSDSSNAELVLRAIGADEIGVVNFSRITSRLDGGTSAQTAVTRATDLLGTKGIVAVDYPAGDPKSRLKRYRIADSYLRFWFRFVEPYLRHIEVGRFDVALRAYETGWETWRGKAIEPLVRQGLVLLAPRLGDPYDLIESFDGWWDRTGQNEFDLVGSSRRGEVEAVGTIKWRERTKVDAGEVAELARARSVVRRANAAKLIVVCPAGVKQGVAHDLLIEAHQLLSAWVV